MSSEEKKPARPCGFSRFQAAQRGLAEAARKEEQERHERFKAALQKLKAMRQRLHGF